MSKDAFWPTYPVMVTDDLYPSPVCVFALKDLWQNPPYLFEPRSPLCIGLDPRAGQGGLGFGGEGRGGEGCGGEEWSQDFPSIDLVALGSILG